MADKKPDHVIRKQIFEIEIDSKEKAHATHVTITDIFYEVVMPILERVFDDYDTPGEILRIDRLEIDLGFLLEGHIRRDIENLLEQKVREAIREKLYHISPAPAAPTAIEGRIPIIRSKIEILIFFLQYGVLPSWAPIEDFSLSELFDQVVNLNRQEFVRRLFRLRETTPGLVRRLASQLGDVEFADLMDVISPGRPTYFEGVYKRLQEDILRAAPAFVPARARRAAREALLTALLSGSETAFIEAEFAKVVRRVLRTEFNIEPPAVLKEIPLADEAAEQKAQSEAQKEVSRLRLIGQRILSGEMSFDEWSDMSPADISIIWEYLFRTEGAAVVEFLLKSIRPARSESKDSPKVKTWTYLFTQHTESLRKVLEKADKVRPALKAVAPFIPAEAEEEVLEWLVPGQEMTVSEFLKTMEASLEKARVSATERAAQIRKIRKTLIKHFAQSERTTGFQTQPVLKAIREEIPEVPQQVQEDIRKFEVDETPRLYQPAPELAIGEPEIEISETEKLRTFFSHLLRFGAVPWWSEYRRTEIPAKLKRFISMDPAAFKEMVTAVFASLTTPGKRRTSIRTLTEWLDEETFTEFLIAIEPEMAGFIISVAISIEKYIQKSSSPAIPASEPSIQTYKWKPVMEYLIRKGKGDVSTTDMIKDVSFTASADLGIARVPFVRQWLATIVELIDSGENRFRPMQGMLTNLVSQIAVPGIESNIEAETLRNQQIREAREEADRKERRIIELRHREDLSQEEIQELRELLNLPPGVLLRGEKKKTAPEEEELTEAEREAIRERELGNEDRPEEEKAILEAESPETSTSEEEEMGDETIKKEKIEVGEDDQELTEEELTREAKRVEEELKKQAEKDIPQQPQAIPEGFAIPERPFELLDAFLRLQYIPAEFGDITKTQFAALLEELIIERPREARSFFQQRLRSKTARLAVTAHFSPGIQAEIIELLKSGQGETLYRVSEELAALFKASGAPAPPEMIQEHRFHYAAIARQVAFSPHLYVRDLATYISKQTGKSIFSIFQFINLATEQMSSGASSALEKVASAVDREVVSLSSMSEEDRRKRERQMDPNARKAPELPMDENIYIQNGGVVMFRQLIPYLFKNLKYVDEEMKEWKDLESRYRAIYLLNYVTFGNLYPEEEFHLALNKFLVGLPITESIPGDIELTPQEKEGADAMINFGINQWSSMRGKEIDQIRVNFLIREGRLSPDHTTVGQINVWNLKVQQKPYDMVLATFPYSYGEILFDWMNVKLKVEWT